MRPRRSVAQDENAARRFLLQLTREDVPTASQGGPLAYAARLSVVGHYAGQLLVLLAAVTLVPLIVAVLGGNWLFAWRLMAVSALSAGCGALLRWRLPGVQDVQRNEALVIGADNLSAGLATAAFIAYLSGLTNVAYSATQYALFSSVMLLLPKFIGGFSGVTVDLIGYPWFFVLTALLGMPVLALVVLAARLVPAPRAADG